MWKYVEYDGVKWSAIDFRYLQKRYKLNCDTIKKPPVKELGGESCPNGASPFVANPIHAGNGNKFQSESDYSSNANNGINFTRYYNSLDERVGVIGVNWRHTYERKIKLSTNGSSVEVIRADGKTYTFTSNSGTWKGDPDVTGKLEETLSEWVYTFSTGTKEYYAKSGKLIKIQHRNGTQQLVNYNSINKISLVTDSFNRSLSFTYNTSGLISEVITPDGSYQYDYDTNKNLINITYPDLTTRQYLYQNSTYKNLLTGIIDGNGIQSSTWKYDTSGRAISSEHAGSNDKTTIVYNSNNTTTVTGPSGLERVYHFENQHGATKVSKIEGGPCTSCSGKTSTVTYDSNGFVASKTDFNGNTTSYINNDRGLQISRTEAVGKPEQRTITTEWDTKYRLPTKITKPGKITTFIYSLNGNLESRIETDTTNSNVRKVNYTYNNLGQVLTIDKERTNVNDVVTYTYDSNGNLSQTKNALGHTSKTTKFDSTGRPLVLEDSNGLITALTYDISGRLKARDVGGEITLFTYDNVGNLKIIEHHDGSILTYFYDSAQRLISVQDQLGNTINYVYDAAGNITKEDILDLNGVLKRTRQQTYNSLGQLIETIGAQNQVTEYGYDGNGIRVAITDAANKTTTSAFDALNRLTKVTDPLDGEVRYTYNNQDNLISITDVNNNVTTYKYDGFGNRIEKQSPDTGLTLYSYDEAGNVVSVKDAKGQITSSVYDELNRLIEVSYHDGTKISYTYDQGTNSVGRLTRVINSVSTIEYEYNVHGRVISKSETINGLIFKTIYSYDLTGRISSMKLPSGKVIGYKYFNGKLDTVTLDGQNIINQIKYEPFGKVNKWQWSNGSLYKRNFNLDGQLINYSLPNEQRSLSYDLRGNIKNIADSSTNQLFEYDELNRINSANDSVTSSFEQSYLYDANSNRLKITNNGIDNIYAYATGSNRLLSISGASSRSYNYDANGNILSDNKHQYRYDSRNRMVSVDDNAYYKHNSLGQRVYKFVRHPFDLNKDNVFNMKDIKLYKKYIRKGEIDNLNDCDGNDVINKKDVKCLNELRKALKKLSKENNKDNDKHGKSHHTNNHFKSHSSHNKSHKYAQDDESHGYHYGREKSYPFDSSLLNYQAETIFNYGEQGQLIGEYNINGSMRQEVIFLGSIPIAVIKNNDIYYVFTDHLSTPRVITDTNNNAVWSWHSDPFGISAANDDPDKDGMKFTFNYRFPGQYFDAESSLHYNYFRDFDPSTGRYVQSDPIGLDGGLNTYGYLNGNPLNGIDLYGLEPGDLFSTPDEAAVDAAKYARKEKVQIVEYGGWIFTVDTECDDFSYSYNFVIGNMKGVSEELLLTKKPANPVAFWHTHFISGDRVLDITNEKFSGDPNVKGSGDKWMSTYYGIPVYLNTPFNLNKVWDPSTQTERIVK